MSFTLIDIPTQGGGWFKPMDHDEAVAILAEPKSFEHQRPTDFGPKDSIVADLTIFDTMDELAAGTPTHIFKDIRVEYTVLTKDLKPLVGSATVVTTEQAVSKKPGQKGAWVWRQATNEAKKAVIAYATKREADIAAALADVPDFD